MTEQPLVFISHDSRDSKIAKEFSNLLRGASGGVLSTFNSSDPDGKRGIEHGLEWYQTIMEKLRQATDVVALLTRRSVDRPWILFEAGVAKGCNRARVFGVTLGISLTDASHGPFGQFQNRPGDEEHLIQLVIELIQRNLGADPIPASIRREVRSFLRNIAKLEIAADSKPLVKEEDLTAKVFEEVKVIGREVRKKGLSKILGPRLCQEFPLVTSKGGDSYDATGWLLLIGTLRDDLPWLYEVGLDLYRALGTGERAKIERAREQVLQSVREASQNQWLRSVLAEKDRELAFRLHYLPDLVETYLSQLEPAPAL